MSRENELLAILERDYVKRGIEVSPGQFALDQGYSRRNGIQRYKRLRAALHDWAQRCGVAEVRGQQRPRLFDAEKATRRELADAHERIEALLAERQDFKERVARLTDELATAEGVARRLRGIASTLLTHFTMADPTRAARLDREVLDWGARLSDPDYESNVVDLRSAHDD